MRGVLIVLFWAWLAVSLTVYGYRLWRRVTQGPKGAREARATSDEGRSIGLGDEQTPSDSLGMTPAPGPSADRPGSPAGARSAGDPEPPSESGIGPRTASTATVAEALRGINLPCDLVPIAEIDRNSATVGRRVVFTTRHAEVRDVAAALAGELENLGYRVSDAATDASGQRRRLIATRADFTVSVAVAVDASGAVAAEVTT